MSRFNTPREKVSVRKVDNTAVERLAQEMNISTVLSAVLVGRGLITYDDCKVFFRPEISSFHDPFLFRDMPVAVSRIRRAIDGNERISIYGDYDVDGVSASALMVRFLKSIGALVDYYLPNRLTEGYGMSSEGVQEIARRGTSLIITVDCGIGANAEISQASARGMDTIVTDHHEPHGELPEAVAILNPKVPECRYPDKGLAGVGVALKLCQALTKDMGHDDTWWTRYLDIVSLGTAADIVPFTGENRTIASLGFKAIGDTVNPGLRALLTQQELNGKPVTTRQVVFQLAPCINAAGRLGDPQRGVRLLLTDDDGEARLYTQELLSANMERRALDAQVQEEAVAWVNDNCDPVADVAIVAGSSGWHAGVIGIAASRVVEAFYRPAFLFSIGPDGIAKGSGRSVPGVHLLEALDECGDLLESWGGHSAAAGATIKSVNIDQFRKRFNTAVSRRVSPGELVPRVVADAETEINTLTPKFMNIINQMQPFGPGNMCPVFLCRNLRNKYEPRIVGKGHLKLSVEQNGRSMDAIAFNFGDRLDEVKKADNFALAFSLEENVWNDKVSLQMKVKGVQV